MGLFILLLLANEEKTYLRVVYDILYLLLAASGLEWYSNGTYSPRTIITEKVLWTIL